MGHLALSGRPGGARPSSSPRVRSPLRRRDRLWSPWPRIRPVRRLPAPPPGRGHVSRSHDSRPSACWWVRSSCSRPRSGSRSIGPGSAPSIERSETRRGVARLAALSAAGILFYFVLPTKAFGEPVSAIVARQLGHLREGASEAPALAALEFPEQTLHSDLLRLGGANVFVIFVESYGITLFEDAQHFERIEPRLRELDSTLRSAGYFFSSAQIRSSTFGGGSWRAHATFLSGLDTGSEHRYDALLQSHRKTLVHVLKERDIAPSPPSRASSGTGRTANSTASTESTTSTPSTTRVRPWAGGRSRTSSRSIAYTRRRSLGRQKPLFLKASLIMTHIPYYPVPAYVAGLELGSMTAPRTTPA